MVTPMRHNVRYTYIALYCYFGRRFLIHLAYVLLRHTAVTLECLNTNETLEEMQCHRHCRCFQSVV